MSEARPGNNSNIYDLGYRRYGGARLGRRAAVLALYLESLRGAFGLGRKTSAKIAPAVLILIAALPAIGQLAVGALVGDDIDIIRHDEYYSLIKYVLALFCAVVAPEIVGRDQRNRTLSLYFSRAISRADYAIGKFLALTTAVLIITGVPQLLLFIGNALATNDFMGYVREDSDQLPPIIISAVVGSALLAAVSIVIAAQTPRRAFATVGIIAAFIFTTVLAGIFVVGIDTQVTRLAVFLSPFDVIDGLTAWVFTADPPADNSVDVAGYGLWTYGLVAVAAIAGGVALIVRRYRAVQA